MSLLSLFPGSGAPVVGRGRPPSSPPSFYRKTWWNNSCKNKYRPEGELGAIQAPGPSGALAAHLSSGGVSGRRRLRETPWLLRSIRPKQIGGCAVRAEVGRTGVPISTAESQELHFLREP